MADYTLTMDSASLDLSGAAVGLLYDRLLPMDSASLDLSGAAVGLLYDRLFPLDSASLDLSGSDISLLYDRLLTAGSVSLDLSGAALAFHRTYVVPKAWAFALDGHIFYVLNDVEGYTFICDLRTGQWAHWFTGDGPKWSMSRGMTWQGHILAGDDEDGDIREIDPDSVLDEATTEIQRAVTAFIPLRGKHSIRQGSLRVTASMGEPSAVDATVRLRFSDDEGETWSIWHSRTLVTDEFFQVLRYRSLGRIRAPGRIWEISDEGGLIRIEGVDSDVG